MKVTNRKSESTLAASEVRIVERQDLTKPGRGIRVVRLHVSAQQVSSVTTALRYGKARTSQK